MGLSVCPADSSIRWSHKPKRAAGVTNKKGTRTEMEEEENESETEQEKDMATVVE